jgi:hypothetical protein
VALLSDTGKRKQTFLTGVSPILQPTVLAYGGLGPTQPFSPVGPAPSVWPVAALADDGESW